MLTWGAPKFSSLSKPDLLDWTLFPDDCTGLRPVGCGAGLGGCPLASFCRPMCCSEQPLSSGSRVKQIPPVLVSLTTRKQGTSFAPLGCNIWQLIFFCQIHVCNPHFHKGILLRPVLRGPAVQTRWLIKGILFVKQSPTSLSCHPKLSLPPSSTLSSSLLIFSLFSLWPSPIELPVQLGQPRQVLVCVKTAEHRACGLCIQSDSPRGTTH